MAGKRTFGSKLGLAFGVFGVVVPLSILLLREFIIEYPNLYVNPVLHALLEAFNSFLALSLGGLLYFLQFRLRWSTKLLWTCAALLSMGTLSLLHAGFTQQGDVFVTFELLHNLVGGLFAACCWLPRANCTDPTTRRLVLKLALAGSILMGGALLVVPGSLPNFVEGNAFTPAYSYLSAFAALLFLSGALRCFIDYRRDGRIKDLYLFDFFLLSGTSALLPTSYLVWGPTWWAWHVVQMVGLLSVLAFFISFAVQFENDVARSEERFRILSKELERSNVNLSSFVSFASHDLREPLRTVRMHLQLLKKSCQDMISPEGKEYLAYAIDGAVRMNRLIEGLLNFAKTSEASWQPDDVGLTDVITEVRTNLQSLVVESGAVLSVGELPSVVGNFDQLVDLFQNLIANAIRYRDPKRPVEIKIFSEESERHWTIGVSDNGIGIDKKDYERVFELLQRLHGAEVEGAGIGLALCRRIVERHGGRIWLQSELNAGTVFFVSFPKKVPSVVEHKFNPSYMVQ